MKSENATTQESTAAEENTDGPRIHVHTGLEQTSADLEELPADVREEVEAHIELTSAYQLEVRHWGEGCYDIVHRHAPPEEVNGDGE